MANSVKPEKKQLIHFLVAASIAVVLSLISPPEGLTPEAMRFAGIFVAVIYLLFVDCFPSYVVGLAGLSAISIVNAAAFGDIWGSMASSSFLMIAAAIGLGMAVVKTGLLNRVALWILKLFPNSYFGRILSLLTVGIVIGPCIPAAASKAALAGPLAASVSDTLGFPKKGKGAAGLFAAAYMSFCVIGLIYLSGTAYALLTVGMMSEEAAAAMTWGRWLLYSLPWGIVVLVLTVLFILFVYKPEKVDSDNNKNYIGEKLESLGKMSRDEAVSGIILVICLLMWMTSKTHGVSATVVSLAGFSAMWLLGVFKKGEFRSKIPWETIIFIGSVLCLASLVGSTGWSDWIGQKLGGVLAPLVSNVYVYIIILSILVILMRFVVISQTATFSLFFVVMAPIAASLGISEFITGFVISAGCLVWNSNYQNSSWLTAFAGAGGDEFTTFKEQLKMSVGYSVMLIVGSLISVPFWKMFGLC